MEYCNKFKKIGIIFNEEKYSRKLLFMKVGVSMKELFERMINKIEEIYPNIREQLNESAKDCELKECQDKLGVKLPQDLLEFYKIYNGLDNDMGIFYGWSFLSIEEVVGEWNMWKSLVDSNTFQGIFSEPYDGIKNDWYNLKWIPIGTDGGGNCICVDLDPAEDGVYGQIISMWHDSPDREIIAESFKNFIQMYVKDLEENKLIYDEDFGHIDYPWNE